MPRNEKLSVLVVGNLTTHPNGATRVVQQLIHSLSRESIELRVVNTARPLSLVKNPLVNAFTGLKVTLLLIQQILKCQLIVYLASEPAMMSYGPVLYSIARLFHRRLVLRLLGGSFDENYRKLHGYRKHVIDSTIFKADLFLLETKHLATYFARLGATNVRWHPNSRPMITLPTRSPDEQHSCQNFVFLGRVIEEKGIGVILSATPMLAPQIKVDIYGPLDGSYTAESITRDGKGVVRYKGVLTPAQIEQELFNYDALILPTYYSGEGHPGVVLEAYSHGLPVIATRWRSVSEIVSDDTGLLIPTHSPEALAEAMNTLHADAALYLHLRQGVATRRMDYSEDLWANQLIDWFVHLVRAQSIPFENSCCTSR